MKRKLLLLGLLSTHYFNAQNSDSITLVNNKESQKNNTFIQKEWVKQSIAPALLFTASATTWGEREKIREIRNRYIPHFEVRYDDYLQYAPTAAVYGLKLSGVKGRNNIGRATLSYAASLAIMGIIVNTVKYTAKVERPDGSSNNSFPSGHTAMAFTNASFLHKEYGIVNPAYSIGAYTASTFTGLGRNLNNRHWISDVLAGAGIGILSSELGYFFINKFYKNKGDNVGLLSKVESSNGNPSFLALKIGSALATTNFLKESALDDKKEKGFEAGLEGAYFFNKNWGVGGSLTFSSFPISRMPFALDDDKTMNFETVTQSMGFLNYGIGPYYAHDFSEKWQMMLRSTAGYSNGASGKVYIKSDMIDLPNNEFEVTDYKPSSSFKWTNGAAITYKLSSELGLTAFADYTTTQSKINYTFNEILKNNEELNEYFNDVSTKEKINYFTLGLKLTAYF